MRRFEGLSSRRLFWTGLVCFCAMLLVALVLVNLTHPQGVGAVAQSALLTPTAPHTVMATTAASHASAGSQASGENKVPAAPSWLVEGLAVLFLLLLGFSLILFPLAMRSARIERRSRPTFALSPPLPEEAQVARLSQIAPERKAPLTPDQLRALREKMALSQEPTAHLAAVRIMDGLPVSLPITEAETMPHLPAATRPIARRAVEDRMREAVGDSQS